MAVFKSYEEIGAWKAGRELFRDVYALTRAGKFTKDLCYITDDQFNKVFNHAKLIAAILQNLIKSISTSEKGITYTR